MAGPSTEAIWPMLVPLIAKKICNIITCQLLKKRIQAGYQERKSGNFCYDYKTGYDFLS